MVTTLVNLIKMTLAQDHAVRYKSQSVLQNVFIVEWNDYFPLIDPFIRVGAALFGAPTSFSSIFWLSQSHFEASCLQSGAHLVSLGVSWRWISKEEGKKFTDHRVINTNCLHAHTHT